MQTGRKHSLKRDAILEALCSTQSHPTAQWIYETVRTEISNLSLSTVYRNLRQLQQDGLAISVGIVHGEERFDGRTKPHPHFICERCRCVIDLPWEKESPAPLLVSAPEDLCIDFRKTTFYGLCGACQKQSSS